jgi:hypothetical protein
VCGARHVGRRDEWGIEATCPSTDEESVRALVAITSGVLSWPFVVFAAAFAMANNDRGAAHALLVAGILACVSLGAGIASLFRSYPGAVHGTVTLIGSLIAAAAGCVTLVFALSFHW